MKIAIISVSAASLVEFRGPLVRSLVAREVEVFALASDYDAVTRESVRCLGARPINIDLRRTGVNPLVDLRDTWFLIRTLQRINPDVFFGYYIKPVVFGTIAAWLAGVPYRVAMIEGLGFVFTDNGKPPLIRKKILRFIVSLLYRFALARADKVIFLNPDDIHDFDQWGILPRERAFELGGIGVDLDQWPFSTAHTSSIRFLFVGRLLVEKGILDFISAARSLRVLCPSAEFIVLGNIDSNPGGITRAQIQAWVDEGLVVWPGYVHVRPWLEQCSVFVLPSYREGVPRSTQEAMATGRPVITTDVPGCRKTVEDGVNGFLVPVRDPDALMNAMLRFIEHPDLVDAMGKESRRLAEERFDIHKVNQKIMNILGLEVTFDQTVY